MKKIIVLIYIRNRSDWDPNKAIAIVVSWSKYDGHEIVCFKSKKVRRFLFA